MRVLLADGQQLVREGIRLVLEQVPGIEVVASVGDGHAAIAEIHRLRPDIAIVDVPLPGLSGLAVVEQTRVEATTRCIILSEKHSCSLVRESLAAGAAAYVVKSAPAAQLIDAIDTVFAGHCYLSPLVTRHVIEAATADGRDESTGLGSLTAREREILKLIGEGLSSKEIASSLAISPRTAEGHRAQLMKKLSIHKLAALVRYSIREGLVDV